MRVTAKSDYALRALVELAVARDDHTGDDPRGTPVSAEELGRLGVDIEERSDGWVIRGSRDLSGGRVRGWGDHRIVMALAVLGLGTKAPVEIEDAEAVSVSFPEFVTILKELGAEVEERASDPEDVQVSW